MKTIRIRVLKASNMLLAGVLAILGFASSCDSKDEYGTPSARFIVNGKVTSEETNLPVQNIRVVMEGDTDYTTSEGVYQVEKMAFPENQTFNIKFEDTDGQINQQFNNLDTIAEFRDPHFNGGDGHWYEGEAVKNMDVKMNRSR